ncbi:pleiotropic drug resistance protein 3-like isoform X2 [Durio zibethinus]|uniref:Pleiotropic drug resistance protein 3-like isoform X2 n=1 Tax=Durio zibethinus TaxID=66656 RepID=A0A6P5Z9A5_DURZI|nr:pleiotropic drug resistance protein 3-like isoform X2 [Durio zibethinus]
MAQLVGPDEIESLRIELAQIGRSTRSSFRSHASSFRSVICAHQSKGDDDDDDDDEYALQWAAVQRLPTFERITTALFDDKEENGTSGNGNIKGKRVVNVTKLGADERHMFVEKLIKQIENDNLRLLQKLRDRIDKVGVKLPTVEVRYKNLYVEAECQLVHGKPLPTLWNATKSMLSGLINLFGSKQEVKINILKDVSGIIKPGRMTLLLGPPGCGKSTLLLALSGKLSHSLKVAGEITYNGFRLEEFVPWKTSAYISQYDLHTPEMTVREVLDFSARFQGIGSRAEIIKEVSRREKQAGIVPDPDIDAYMKILGLDICADTMVGDTIRRGISGGQKKRLTTGEIIVGPTKALFMDEISNGLDSSTTFQIVSYLQHLVHINDATALISLLQPAPETFDLFDDVILMAEGKTVYQGPRTYICKFFEDCGFKCPERKGIADFLQEVISRKDQAQYWFYKEQPYSYVSVDQFIKRFKECHIGQNLDEELSKPFHKSQSHRNALSFKSYSLNKWELFKACSMKELLLMKRNSFTYVFKAVQLVIIASITMTVFLRTRMAVDAIHSSYFMGSLFYALVILLVDGFPELSMTVSRIAVFYKQRELCFYPAWAYAIPAAILKFPLSLLESFVWTSMTYYVIGYSPEVGRFFRQFLLYFGVHLASISMFRCIASLFQTIVASTTVGALAIMIILLFGGFILPRPSLPSWLEWGFWLSPLTYGEIGLTVNEFLAPRWEKVMSGNTSLGQQTLESRGLGFDSYFYWISIAALFGFMLFFNVGFTFALTFLQGAFRPGVLTALMGVSGAGKTTLMDVLSGRKTGGFIEGDIRIGGYPKAQDTFARVSGYCEQNDINSPLITVEESLVYSASLRLPSQIDSKTKAEFVNKVIETIELDGVRDTLVGIPGVNGLSTEQRKRLTIAVELVANPSIIFMDEPTSGLDARAAAIVMRAVKNVVEMGRTVVCTIHQPSIDIFEAFDELILMKTGGRIIYSGPLGESSSRVIEYFQNVPGVPKIKDNYNPATWMLEVTTKSIEAGIGIDFAQIYEGSTLYKENKELIKRLSSPTPGSTDLYFPTRFPQNGWEQFKACLWKQFLSYWRSPSYNLTRIIFMSASSLLFGILFWQQGKKINNQQDLFNIVGSMYAAIIFFGINNCSTVLPLVATERAVFYRERFAGMYSSWAYSMAQVLVEIPYLFTLAIIYIVITYPMIGYYWSTYKIFWSFYSMFCSLLYFNYLGMMLVSLTPNIQVASIVASSTYTMMNLFSGFILPKPQIPKWWLWLFYLCPTSWALNGMLASQYGDIEKEIMAFGETKTVAAFLEDYFGFHHNFLGMVAVVLFIFPVLFATLFAFFIGRLNFQKR